MARSTDPFRYFDSSPEVIRLVVMMYVKYPLSLRNVEDLLFERGIDICHETVRLWWNRFGPMFAAEIRKRRVDRMRAHTHWRWHLDEVYVKINGEMRYLWRAVDHEGEVLESYVTTTRDKAAALAFIKQAMKRHAGDKQMRMSAQTGLIENGMVFIPAEAHWLAEYLHELTVFPNGRYDDQVDSTSQALSWIGNPGIKHWGFLELILQENRARGLHNSSDPPEIDYAPGSLEWAARRAHLQSGA